MSTILLLPALPLVLAAVALVLPARWGARLALLSAAATLAIGAPLARDVVVQGTLRVPLPLVPALGIPADLALTPLGAWFVVLIGAIGLAITAYARVGLGAAGTRGFWALWLLFTGAMLGIVVADSLVVLYVAWELTTIASALLIAGDARREAARRGALQALLVTGAGGLCLLAGIVLLARLPSLTDGGAWTLSGLAANAAAIVADPGHRVPLALVLVGAFAKSAQFPLHFWLPGAMAAPAPVSAYLHSATMVKAGIYLLGAILPVFGGSPLWTPILATVGLGTFVIAGWSALAATDAKLLLAYSTCAQLGAMTAAYGLVPPEHAGIVGVLIVSHALYKSALFLLVGWLEKVTGTRDLEVLSATGWGRAIPGGTALLAVGAAAMAGVPLTLGFVAKEVLLHLVDDARAGPLHPWPFTLAWLVAALVGGALATGYALKLVAPVLVGPPPDRCGEGDAPLCSEGLSPWFLLAPASLLALQLVGGLLPARFVAALAPRETWPAGPAVWHALPDLATSLGTFAVGGALYAGWKRLARADRLPGPESAAELLWRGALALADRASRGVQAGGHPRHLVVILAVAVGGVVGGLHLAPTPPRLPPLHLGADAALAWIPAVGVLAAALATMLLHDRTTQTVLIAAAGYGIAVFYALFRAPDLALTQILVDTVSLVLLLLVFRRLPPTAREPRSTARVVVHGTLALAVAAAMGFLALSVGTMTHADAAGDVQLALALPEGHGRNVVNVILVDFRAVDTLGEIVVLAIAALGAASLRRVPGRAPLRPMAPRSRSNLLRMVTQAVAPVLGLYAIHLLVFGHDRPGGGFVAGLIVASGLVLQALGFGVAWVRTHYEAGLRPLFAIGVALSGASGVLALARGRPYLTHAHTVLSLPGGGGGIPLSTALLFDLGVFLVVVGATITALGALAEDV